VLPVAGGVLVELSAVEQRFAAVLEVVRDGHAAVVALRFRGDGLDQSIFIPGFRVSSGDELHRRERGDPYRPKPRRDCGVHTAVSAIHAVTTDVASMLSSCTVCRSWAEQDEGPYHRDAQPERRDVVEDREGAVLQLGIRLVGDQNTPLRDAAVEIWQCDAMGRYSGFPPPDASAIVTAETAPRAAYLPDQTFLRGRQRIDGAGMVEFRTIYPGWYPGRTVHIHLMIHTGEHVLTSQLYFPEEISDEVLARAPYAARPRRDTTNGTDEIFATGGDPAVLSIVPVGDGYRAGICLELPKLDDAS
jgi:protocatechuate 3,4-dioxygenase beta subunit